MGYSEKYLGQELHVEMDRPKGSKHPVFNYDYPVNYGFIPDTKAPDGKEIDAYVLGTNETLSCFNGKCIAIIKRLDDDDDKLIVVPHDINLTDDEIYEQVNFQEQYFISIVIR